MGSIPVASPTPPRKFRLSRKALLLLAVLVAMGAGTGVLLIFAWSENRPAQSYAWTYLGKASDLPVNQPVLVQEHRLFLVRQPAGEVLALFRRDPRLGCTIVWRPDFPFDGRTGWFRNPCHSQTYSLTGRCVSGPCARDMDRFPVAIVNGGVLVDVQNHICGSFAYSLPPPAPGSPTPQIFLCVPPELYRGSPPGQ